MSNEWFDLGNGLKARTQQNFEYKPMLTIREHLETLPEPIRTEALDRLNPVQSNRPVSAPSIAVLHAFYWGTGAEAAKWLKVYEELDINGH